MLDEKSLRRPTFDEANSAPVVLADGQTWFLPKPFLRLRPRVQNGRVSGYGPLTTADANGTGCGRRSRIPRKARRFRRSRLSNYMILRSYDLNDDQLGDLFAWDTQQTWASEFLTIANGRTGPKAGSGGDI